MADKTIYRKARINYSGYSSQVVGRFAGTLVESIQSRLLEGKDKYDRQMPDLSPRYKLSKGRKYPPAVRNMKKTGRTFREMGVLSANENGAKIGVRSGEAQRRINAQKQEVWGSSQRNSKDLADAIAAEPFPAKWEQL